VDGIIQSGAYSTFLPKNKSGRARDSDEVMTLMQSLNLPVFPELGKGNVSNMNLNDIMVQNAAG
jgi:hypothetical protein